MVFAGSSPITTTSPSSKARPFLSQHYPASTVIRPRPTPAMAAALHDVEAATLALDGSPPVTTNHPTDVPCPLPRRIAWVRMSIASPRVRPSPNDRRVGIRIRTFEACSGFTFVTAHRIAQQPKAAFVAGLQPSQLPSRAACQLPDQSTIIRVRPSLTGSSRPRGARSNASVWPSVDDFRARRNVALYSCARRHVLRLSVFYRWWARARKRQAHA
jgi:hypothetical protein